MLSPACLKLLLGGCSAPRAGIGAQHSGYSTCPPCGHSPSDPQVEERCPNCGFHQMEFYTMQLRSADEGQTVFYECKECGCAEQGAEGGVAGWHGGALRGAWDAGRSAALLMGG